MAYKTCEVCRRKKKDVKLRNKDQNECAACYNNRLDLVLRLEIALQPTTTPTNIEQNETTLAKKQQFQTEPRRISLGAENETAIPTIDRTNMEELL